MTTVNVKYYEPKALYSCGGDTNDNVVRVQFSPFFVTVSSSHSFFVVCVMLSSIHLKIKGFNVMGAHTHTHSTNLYMKCIYGASHKYFLFSEYHK